MANSSPLLTAPFDEHSTAEEAVDVRPLELADPTSVAAFVDRWHGPLDILINPPA